MREIRAFDYVNQPYESVRDALSGEAAAIFQRATRVAEDRSGDLFAALSVDIQGVTLSKEIAIRVGKVEEHAAGASPLSRVTSIELVWQAADSPRLFPVMTAELRIYPLSASETQIELKGQYEPPLGLLGSAVDAMLGHRIAEASVHRFVREVVDRLRGDLA